MGGTLTAMTAPRNRAATQCDRYTDARRSPHSRACVIDRAMAFKGWTSSQLTQMWCPPTIDRRSSQGDAPKMGVGACYSSRIWEVVVARSVTVGGRDVALFGASTSVWCRRAELRVPAR